MGRFPNLNCQKSGISQLALPSDSDVMDFQTVDDLDLRPSNSSVQRHIPF